MTNPDEDKTITYVTVGVERIQSYLARSRHLWGRRGASDQLVRLTMSKPVADRHGIEGSLAVEEAIEGTSVTVNEEGLDIDGVVSLKGPNEKEAIAAGTKLALKMRATLPACLVKLSWITPPAGATYAQLLPDEAQERWTPVTYAPVSPEFPAARPCDECRLAPATRQVPKRFADETEDPRLCADCLARREWNERRGVTVVKHAGSHPVNFAAEWWLQARLGDARGVQTFDDLGAVATPFTGQDGVRRTRTHRGNHTALIFADGNGMGALFARAKQAAASKTPREGRRSTEDVLSLSVTVKDAIGVALETATKDVWSGPGHKLPVIPHIVGGDDVLVSVAGEGAWRFLDVFLSAFRSYIDDNLHNEFGETPSISAGMVLCKAEYPFGDQVELAELLMKRAKRHVAGNGWSFTWADVTVDGPDGPFDPEDPGRVGYHRVWTLNELEQYRQAIDELRLVLSANAVQSVSAAVGHPNLEVARRKADHLASRMPAVRSFFARCGYEPKRLTNDQVAIILDIVSMGRWWQ